MVGKKHAIKKHLWRYSFCVEGITPRKLVIDTIVKRV